MKKFHFFCACFFGCLTIIYAAPSVNTSCLENEKALASLEAAEILLSKASASFPTCKEEVISTDESGCGRKRSLAYIEISKKLISDLRRNFPRCSKPIDKVDKIVQGDNYKDCSEILSSGHNESGVYRIWIGESSINRKALEVYCDMETEDGWTVIQRRGQYPVQQDFYQGWESYKNGFGNITQEFWLGNENIRVLCLKGCEIRFDLQDKKGEKRFAYYYSFSLSSSNYRLNISGFAGNVDDSMKYHNNKDFSTKDKGDTVRAEKYWAGWWHGDERYYANLNGMYQAGNNNQKTVHWYDWRGNENLASVEMKVKLK